MRIGVRVIVAVGLLAACQVVEDQVNNRENAVRERKVVTEYAEAVGKLSPQREAFLGAVRATNQGKNATEVGATVTGQTLVALGQYAAALNAIEPDNESLRKIHAVIREAIEGLLKAHTQFAADLSASNYTERRKALESEYARFYKLQADYQSQLGTYYETLGLELRTPGQQPTTN